MSEMDTQVMMERAAEIEDTFSYDGYQIARREMFAHLREPAVTIRKDSITFNTACINGLEDAVYIQILVNSEQHRIAIRQCEEEDKDAIRWCIAKPDKRKSRKMTGREFSSSLYKTMGWDENCRYKILGYRIEFEGETLYIFDLTVPEIFHERPRKVKTAETEESEMAHEEEQEQTTPVNTRKGFYPDDIAGTFGLPVEEHRKSTEVKEMDGYVSYGMITGNNTGNS